MHQLNQGSTEAFDSDAAMARKLQQQMDEEQRNKYSSGNLGYKINDYSRFRVESKEGGDWCRSEVDVQVL